MFKIWLQPVLSSTLRSSSYNKAYKTPGSGLVTIGGDGALSHAARLRGAARISANMTLDNESEERIFQDNEVKVQVLYSPTESQRLQGGIIVSKQVSVTTESFGKDGTFRQL